MKRKRRCLVTTIFLLTLLKTVYMEYTDEIYDDSDRHTVGEELNHDILNSNVYKSVILNRNIDKRDISNATLLHKYKRHIRRLKTKLLSKRQHIPKSKRQNIPMIRMPYVPKRTAYHSPLNKRSHLTQKEMTFQAMVTPNTNRKDTNSFTKDKISEGNKEKAKQLELADENPGNPYGSKTNPAKSCRDIFLTNRDLPSGNYWIKTADDELLLVTCGFPTRKQKTEEGSFENHENPHEVKKEPDHVEKKTHENVDDSNEGKREDTSEKMTESHGSKIDTEKEGEQIIKSKETSNFLKSKDKEKDEQRDDGGRLANFQDVPPMVKEYLLSNHIHVPGLNLGDGPPNNFHKKAKPTIPEESLRNPAPHTRSPGPSNSMQKDNPNKVKSVPTKPQRYSRPTSTTPYATLVPPPKTTPTVKTRPTRKKKPPSRPTKPPHTTLKITTPLHTTIPSFRSSTKKKTTKKKLPDDLEEFEEDRKNRKTTMKMMRSSKRPKPTAQPTKKKSTAKPAPQPTKKSTTKPKQRTTLPPGIEAPPTLTPFSSTTESPEIIAPPPLSKVKSEDKESFEITQQFVKAEKPAKENSGHSFSGKALTPDNIKVHLPQLEGNQTSSENNTQPSTEQRHIDGNQPPLHRDPNKPFVLINGISSDPRESPYQVERQQENIDFFAHSNEHVQADGSLAFPTNHVVANQKAKVESIVKTESVREKPLTLHFRAENKTAGDGAGDLGDIQQDFPSEIPNNAKKEVSQNNDDIYRRRGNNVPTSGEIHHPDKDIRNDYKAAVEFETQPQIRSWGFREKNMLERERFDKQYSEFDKLDKSNITVKPYVEEGAFKKSWAENRQEMARQKFKEQYDEFEKINQELKEKEEGLNYPHMKASENYAAQYKAFEDFKNASSTNSTDDDTNDKASNTTKDDREKDTSKQSFSERHHDDGIHDNNITTHYVKPDSEKPDAVGKIHEDEKFKEDKSDSYLNYIKAIEDNGGGETPGENTTKPEKNGQSNKLNGKNNEDRKPDKQDERNIDNEMNSEKNNTKDGSEKNFDEKQDNKRENEKNKENTNYKSEKSEKEPESGSFKTTDMSKDEKTKTDDKDSTKEKDEKDFKNKGNLKDTSDKEVEKLPKNFNSTDNAADYKNNATDSEGDMIKIGKGNHPAMYTNAPLGTTTTNATSFENIDGERTKVEDANATVMLSTKKDTTLNLGTIGNKSFKQIDVKQFLKNEKLNPSGNVHEDIVMDDEGSDVLDMFFKNKGSKKDSKEVKKLKQLSGPPNPSVEKAEDEMSLKNDSQKMNADIQAMGNTKTEPENDKKESDETKVFGYSKGEGANNTEKYELYKKLHGAGNVDLTTSKPSNIYVDNRVFIYGNVKGGSAPQLSHAIRNHNKEGEQTVERKLKIESNADDVALNDDPGLTKSNISNDKKDVKNYIKSDNPDFAVTEDTPDISGMQPFQEVKEYDKKFNLNNLFKGSNISIENHVHTTGSLKALVRTAPVEAKKPVNSDVEKSKLKTVEFVIPEPKTLSFTSSNGKSKLDSTDTHTMEQEARINFIRKQALDQDDVSMGKFSTSGLKEFEYNQGQNHISDDNDSKKNAGKRTKQKSLIRHKPGNVDPERRTKMIDYLLKKKDTRTAFHLNQDIRDFGAIKKSNGLDQWLEAANAATGGKKSEIVSIKKSTTAVPVQEEDDIIDLGENNNTKISQNSTEKKVAANATKAQVKTENISIETTSNGEKKSLKKKAYETPINQESLPGAGDVGDVFEGVDDETPPQKRQFNVIGVNNPNYNLAANMQHLLNNAQKTMGNVPGYTEENRREEQRAKENRNKNINNSGNQVPQNNKENSQTQNSGHTQSTGAQENGMIHTINDTGSQLNGENLPGMDEQFSIRKRSLLDTEVVSKNQIQLGNVASVHMNNKTFFLIYNLHSTNKSSDLKLPEKVLSNLTSQIDNASSINIIQPGIKTLHRKNESQTLLNTFSKFNQTNVLGQEYNSRNYKNFTLKTHSGFTNLTTEPPAKNRSHFRKSNKRRRHHVRRHGKRKISRIIRNETFTKTLNSMQENNIKAKQQPLKPTQQPLNINKPNYYVSNEANRYSKNYSMVPDEIRATEKLSLANKNSTHAKIQNQHKNKSLSASINQTMASLNNSLGEWISRRLTSSALYFHSFRPTITQVLDNRHDKVQLVSYDEPKDQFLSYGQNKNALQDIDSEYQDNYLENNYMKPMRRTNVNVKNYKNKLQNSFKKEVISTRRRNSNIQTRKHAYLLNSTSKNLSTGFENGQVKSQIDRFVPKKNSLKLYVRESTPKSQTQNIKPVVTSTFDIRAITSPAIRLYQNITEKHDLKDLLFNGVFPEAKDVTQTVSKTTKRTSKIIGSRPRTFRNMELKHYLKQKHNPDESNVRLKKSKISSSSPSYNKLLDELSQLKRKRRSNETEDIEDDENGVARTLIPSKVGHIQPSNIVPLPPVGHDPDEPPQSPIATDQTESNEKGKLKGEEQKNGSKNKTSDNKDSENEEKGDTEIDEKGGKDKGKKDSGKTESEDEKSLKEKKKGKNTQDMKTNTDEKKEVEKAEENKTNDSIQKAEHNKPTENVETTQPPITEPHIIHPKTPHTTEPPPPKPDDNKNTSEEQADKKPHPEAAPQEDKTAEAEPNIPTESVSNETSVDAGDSGKDEVGTGSKPLKIQSDRKVDKTFEAGLQDGEKSKGESQKQQSSAEPAQNNKQSVQNTNMDLGEQQPNDPSFDIGNLTTFNYPVNVTVLEQGILQLINQTAPKLKTGKEKLKEEMEKALREKNKQYPALKLPVKNGEYIPPDNDEEDDAEPEPIAIPDNKKHEKNQQRVPNTPLPPPKIPSPANVGAENEFAEIIDSTPTESALHTTVHVTPKPISKSRKEDSVQPIVTEPPKDGAKPNNPSDVETTPSMSAELNFPSLQTDGNNQIPIIPIAKDSPLGKLLYPALGDRQTPTLGLNDASTQIIKNTTVSGYAGSGYSDILLKQTKKLLNEGKLNRRDLLRLLQTSKKQYITKQQEVIPQHEPSEQMFILFPDKNDDTKDLADTTPKLNLPGIASDIVNLPSLSGYYKSLNDQGEVRSKVTNSPIDSKTLITLPNLNNGGFTVQKYNNGLVLVPNSMAGARREKILPQNINLDVHYKITSTQKKNVIGNRDKPSTKRFPHFNRIVNDT